MIHASRGDIDHNKTASENHLFGKGGREITFTGGRGEQAKTIYILGIDMLIKCAQ